MKHLLILTFCFLILSGIIQGQTLIWDSIYKPAENDYADRAYAGCAAYDGNYLLGGYTTSFTIWVGDYYLMKIGKEGDTLWTATYGSAYRDYGEDIIELYDSGFAALGFGRVNNDAEDYRVRLYRTDSLGNLSWEKFYQGASDLYAKGIVETIDSGFAIVGYTYTTSNDIFVLRTDSLGDSLWLRTYGADNDEIGYDIQITPDGGFLIATDYDTTASGSGDFHIMRLDANGDSLWSLVYDYGEYDGARAIEPSGDGNYLAAGLHTYIDPAIQQRMFAVKFQEDGTVLWESSIYAGLTSTGTAICGASDGGAYLSGNASFTGESSNIILARLAANGDSLWTADYGGSSADYSHFIHQDDEDYIYVGGQYASSSYGDYYFLKIEDLTLDIEPPNNLQLPEDLVLHQNNPNPFNAATRINYCIPRQEYVELAVYNILGREVRTLFRGVKSAGEYFEIWDGKDSNGQEVSSGIYFYRLVMNNKSQTRKMIMVK